MKKKNRKLKIIIFSIITIIIFIFSFYSPVIFQEGNPLPLFKAIIKLNISSLDIVKLDFNGDKYLTKSRNSQDILENKLKNQGYYFVEQLGSGYLFKNNNSDALIITRKQYSRFYHIWTIF